MTVVEFLAYLEDKAVKLWVDDDRLRYKAPPGVMNTTLSKEVAQRKTEIMALLEETAVTENQSIQPVSRDGHLPLSFTQKRFWFLEQMEDTEGAYNMFTAVQMNGALNISVLQQTFSEICQRHEILRTTFVTNDGQPTQLIQPPRSFHFSPCKVAEWENVNHPLVNLQDVPNDERKTQAQQLALRDAQRTFDLEHGPLWRIALIQLSADEYLILFTMHHIIADGWSISILVKELTRLYPALLAGKPSPLTPLSIQYVDYVHWQKCHQDQFLQQQIAYWHQQLVGPLPTLELPTDRPRPPVQTFQGKTKTFNLSPTLSGALQQLSQQEDTTLFMTLLAAFKVLLYRYSGQTDLIVGTPIANRKRAELETLIGPFINTLALRTKLSANLTFRKFLKTIRNVTLQAYAHQEVPFEKLVEELHPERDLSRSPIFQTLFILQNTPTSTLSLPNLSLTPAKVETKRTQLDLELSMSEGANGLAGVFVYNTDLFNDATIDRLSAHFQILLEGIVTNPNQQLVALPLMDIAERRQLLVNWNDTQRAYPHEATIHQLFEAQAAQTPTRTAVAYKTEQLTYKALNQRANKLAHHLRSLGVGPETPVAIFMERCAEVMVGLLAILKAGGAYLPLDPTYPSERLAFMVKDRGASIVVTQAKLAERLPPDYKGQTVFIDKEWSAISHCPANDLTSSTTAENLAYTIYTSGSTGLPKGVQITHKAVINFLNTMRHRPGLNADDILLAVTTLCFDISVLELFLPLLNGAQLLIADSVETADGFRLKKMITTTQATVVQATPATWRMLLDSAWPGDPQLKILCGGEALSRELADRLLNKSAELWNMYGPTEATIWATIDAVNVGDTAVIPIGKPIANTEIFILDKNLEPVPIGAIGRLYIGGVCLSRGYWCRPNLSASKFIPHPFSQAPGSRLYDTGDFARYQPDGTIEFFGRADHQVKIRGFRIELGEIETLLNKQPEVQATAVIARPDASGHNQLLAYLVPQDDSLTSAVLQKRLHEKLPDYMVPRIFVWLKALPLTPNGKIDRRALPDLDVKRPELDSGYVPPKTPVEEMLAGIWSEVLSIEQIGIHDNFFDLGGHSLLATQVVSRIAYTFQVEIALRSLFETPTIASLAKQIHTLRENGSSQPPALLPIHRDQLLPLSFAQRRLWFLDQLVPNNTAYNLSGAIRLKGHLNITAFSCSFAEITRRHETLRTYFTVDNDRPFQIVKSFDKFTVPFVDLSGLSSKEQEAEVQKLAEAEASRPFDLNIAPLFRVFLLHLNNKEHVVIWTMHHIISDGWSMGILIQELAKLYTAFHNDQPSSLTDLPIQYADFSHWQQHWLQGNLLQEQIGYWREQLTNPPPALELPIAHPRPALPTSQGETSPIAFSRPLSQALSTLSRQENVTLFMLMLAALKTLLYRYTGQTDVLIGSGIANRNRYEIEGLIGFFVNTLALRNDLSGNPSFRDLLQQVRETTLGAYAHQDLPFEKLVEEIQPERDLSRMPLFQITFAFQNVPTSTLELPDLTLDSIESPPGIVRFDLECHLWQDGDCIGGLWMYNTDLFDESDLVHMTEHYTNLLESIVDDPTRRLSELQLLSTTEQTQLISTWNNTQASYPLDLTLPQRFAAQVQKTPEATALIFDAEHLSYETLDGLANRLAHALQQRGIGPDQIVGLCFEPSPFMVISMLAAHKAGGAYVPLDPSYPPERLAFMVADAQMSLLLTTTDLLDMLPEFDGRLLCLDQLNSWAKQPAFPPPYTATSDNIAYVIYTSGSTGQPKGVQVSHRAIVNTLSWRQDAYPVFPSDRVLQSTPFAFDASVWAFFAPLLAGASLVLADTNTLQDISALIHFIQTHLVTIVQLPPSRLQLLLDTLEKDEDLPLRRLICGSEAMPVALKDRCLKQLSASLHNLYGPTEVAIDASAWDCQLSDEKQFTVPIGYPIANKQLYVLDAMGKPLPTNIPGELYIGGEIARGYLSRPALTAEKFVPDSFSEIPGLRLYRTGDVVRLKKDGYLEFNGRLDHQVKIRGLRIELGEIETILAQHPTVRETVLVAHQEANRQQLIAYVVPETQTNDDPALVDEYIDYWHTLYEGTYAELTSEQDATFNISGWVSSYTKLPIPAAEMRAWVDNTVAHVLALEPRRVLEIGCGTGLLLFRLIPHCTAYCGTDFSQSALDYIEEHLPPEYLPKIALQKRAADDLHSLQETSFDTIIINSVTQYFPNVNYLVTVLQDAVKLVAPGGHIFIGDVRSLTLLEAFHTAVQLHQAPASMSTSSLNQKVNKNLLQDKELVVAPELFIALKQQIPQISHVQVHLKKGDYQNELSKFRYDVTLHVGDTQSHIEPVWYGWKDDHLTLTSVHKLLNENLSQVIGIRHVPDGRTAPEVQAHKWLADESDEKPKTAQALRNALEEIKKQAANPSLFWDMAEELSYQIEISWSPSGGAGTYDVVFIPQGISQPVKILNNVETQHDSWQEYANRPTLHNQYVHNRDLRNYLQTYLPEYMVPTYYILLDAMPLTPNGKVNRKALPLPQLGRPDLGEQYVAPRDPVEEIIAAIWSDVLGIQPIGIHDNFFDLGGHSLLATQVISRLHKTFQVKIPLRSLFESPTVARLATLIITRNFDDLEHSRPPLVPAPRDKSLQLSFGQQRLWFLNQLASGSAYNIPAAFRITGNLKTEALKKSIFYIIERHEALRTIFAKEEGQPIQIILPPENRILMPLVDLTALPKDEQNIHVRHLASAEAQKPFDLSHSHPIRFTLIKLSEAEHVALLTLHHIAFDGWSMSVFMRELAQLYEIMQEGDVPQFPQLTIQYADFAQWQRQWLQGETLAHHLDYWKQKLALPLPYLELPTDRPRPPIQTFQGDSYALTLPEDLSQSLKSLGKQQGATIFMVLLAAYKVLLYRYTGQTNLIVGTPVANRHQTELEELIGFFVNTLPLRTDLSGNPSFLEIISRIRQTTLEAYTYQNLPFEKIVEELQVERDTSHHPIFQSMFVLQNTPMPSSELADLRLQPIPFDNQTAKFDLTLNVMDTPTGLKGEFEYNTDLFNKDTVARMASHFQILLEQIVANPEQPLGNLSLLTDPERRQLLQWNNTAVSYPRENTIDECFNQQVQHTPNKVALVQDKEQLSYQALERKANQLATQLRGWGVQPGTFVAVYMSRSIENIVALLAVLKAGGAYVPIDPVYPPQRVAAIVENALAKIVLTQSHLYDQLQLPAHVQVKVIPDQTAEFSKTLEASSGPGHTAQNLAYAIYTSGSTGQPKGVMIEHRSVLNLASWHQRTFQLHPGDQVTHLAGLSFDASVWEIWPALLSGATLHLVDEAVRVDPKKLQSWLLKQQITSCFIPTPLAEAMLQLPWPKTTSLRHVLTGGDRLRHFPSPDIPFTLVNNYGPTENTVVTTSGVVQPLAYEEDTYSPRELERPLLGTALDNQQLYVLDPHLNPLPVGIPGELYIGGDSLAPGYLHQPVQTAASFIPNPFGNRPGARLYHTGDLVRYRDDGQLEFLGRLDHQVKIRGYRIEPGEIETILKQHPAIADALVVLDQAAATARLIAYLIAGPSEPSQSELRHYLEKTMPDYMVPALFVFLESYPQTPNGKVDRRALPAPDRQRATLETAFVAPRDLLEHRLAQIWKEVLQTPTIGIKDNFFEMGGHSLLATNLIEKVEQSFGLQLALATLFQKATIERLASVIRNQEHELPWSPLVQIQAGQSEMPFFCVHPSGGGVYCYVELAKEMGEGQSFYGLQARGVDGNGEPHVRFEKMAEEYIEVIRNVQPHGPYWLGGWSSGGMVAYEVAQQLQSQGEEVALLALIDTRAFPETLDDKVLMDWLLPELDGPLGAELNGDLNELKALSPEAIYQKLLNQVQSIRAQVVLKLNMAVIQAMRSYQPSPYNGRVALLRIENLLEKDLSPTYGWERLINEPIELHLVPANHHNIIKQPAVQHLAQKLRVCLEKNNYHLHRSS